MLKTSVSVIGLGLTLSLGGCIQAEPAVETPVSEMAEEKTKPGAASGSMPVKPERQHMDTPPPRDVDSERPRGERRGPPQAAFDACASVALEGRCSFETPRGMREGICRQRDDMDSPVCMPLSREGDRPPRPNGERPEGPRPGGN